MKRMALILLLWIAGIAGAFAQTPVTVIGPITAGHCPQFSSNNVLKDGGFACSGAPGNAITALTGDGTATGPGSVPFTLTTVNSNVGSFGSATQCVAITVNGKGLITAASAVTCTPAIASVTGLGTSIASALSNALNASGGLISPTPTRAGDIIYWNGSSWTSLAGNNSGTNCLQENPSGVPSFAACASATSLTVGTTTVVSGTSNGVIFNNAGVVGNTAAGTQGQHLGANGSGTPVYQSGGWTLLNTLTASNSATLSDTTSFTSTYPSYEIVFENIQPATATTQCQIQVHSGGSFQTTSYLASAAFNSGSAGGQIAQTTYVPCNAGVGATTVPMSGFVRVQSPSSTTLPKIWNGQTSQPNSGGTSLYVTNFGGYWSSNSAIDGFQLLFSSGNITSGTIKIYGRL